ncbi:MAG TPA: arylsulfatase [Pirellulales bacterium]|jgi:arylsulfatase A-like enzyme|nr:arylsulfatase [Pirellulales bacterium]
MLSKVFGVVVVWAAIFATAQAADVDANQRPNVVLILADDLGYRDLGCYGATKVKTPNVDRLAREGRLFTDAHAPAAVCTPTRYALMTGREYYRVGRKWNRDCLIEPGSTTLASICHEAGYDTGLVGKWHLGYGVHEPNWNGELKPGPMECGFDSFFGTAMTHNEPPQVLVDGHHVVGLSSDDPIRILPADARHPHGVLSGGRSALVVHEDLCELHTKKAVEFIERHADRPFLLHYGMINVHVPLTPGKRFQGTSAAGVYGDYIQELDWSVGQVLKTLDRLGLAERTLVIFTSDNGGVLHRDAVRAGHLANGELLGQKTDVWEGGHRVPFVVRWPGHVPAKSECRELIALTDMLATVAAIQGRTLAKDEAIDSLDVSAALLDQPHRQPLRPFATIIGTEKEGIRAGKWVFYPKHGSGGLTTTATNPWFQLWGRGWQNSDYTSDGQLKPDAPPGQLYDLLADPRETTNLYRQHPQVVERLGSLLKQAMEKGESARAIVADYELVPAAD